MRRAFAALVALATADPHVQQTEHGIIVGVGPGMEVRYKVSLSIANTGFRVGVGFGPNDLEEIPTPMVQPVSHDLEFVHTKDGEEVGIRTSFGEVRVGAESGRFRMFDSRGRQLIHSTSFSDLVDDSVVIVLGRGNHSAKPASFFPDAQVRGYSLATVRATATVRNKFFAVPHFWTTDGYSAFCVGTLPHNPEQPNQYTVSWMRGHVLGGATWTVLGSRADLYLTPVGNANMAQVALWQLTGAPAIPPKYAFGFLASRWGWKDEEDIDAVLSTFRDGKFPIDAWISDFEWYTSAPDYDLPDEGSPTFEDFGYNNITFPDPIGQLQRYHDHFHVRFGGIRKPRLGNMQFLDMAREKGWLVPAGGQADGGNRNLNYSIPAVRDWYRQEMKHYLEDGVDFWWNDEGESTYYTTYWWTEAEARLQTEVDDNKRFFAINRDYTPGMQRFGAAVWTGDQPESWEALQRQPLYLLAWQQAGVGFVTCDTGGFRGGGETPELLVRWYQMSTFMSIMRVHSTKTEVPHFPWLWGAEAEVAMRKAMNLRYRFIPMLYSLAHHQYATFEAMFHPLLYYWPEDPHAQVATDQWFVGHHLMVAPMLSVFPPWRQVYLPPGLWHHFNPGTAAIQGPHTITLNDVALDHIPMYVLAGGIVPMAPIVQRTGELPGGPLMVRVYAGADGEFQLVEDDGETLGYQRGDVRKTHLEWHDANSTLTWSVVGDFSDDNVFTALKILVCRPDGGTQDSPVLEMGRGGSYTFPPEPALPTTSSTSPGPTTTPPPLAPPKPTATGIVVRVGWGDLGYGVELAVAGPHSFRLSVAYDHSDVAAIDTPMIQPLKDHAKFEVVKPSEEEVGLRTEFGYLVINMRSGEFKMEDSSGKPLVTSRTLSEYSEGTITVALGRGNQTAQPAAFFPDPQGDGDSLESIRATATVRNKFFEVPHYWTTDGYSAFCVGTVGHNPEQPNQYTVSWLRGHVLGGATWTILGERADIYLTPVADARSAQRALWTLTGPPAILPKYAFGFLASRWGWKDAEDIDEVLSTFRDGEFPIDGWISDFEWYTKKPDYDLPDEGESNFTDFGYNPVTFPDPIGQLQRYHDHFGMKFGGIRKPRLGNSELLDFARDRDWLISAGGQADGGNRNLNYSIPAVREWYQSQMRHYLQDGVDFWWNDEGESTYFTTYWWTVAEADLLHSENADKRFFAINRDYTPGMQRYGAAVWTGDQTESWEALQRHPAYLLSWQQAGVGYVTCDTGGFKGGGETPELLVRWYQLSIFMSVMRVHSTKTEVPHFPWLWGPDAEHAMRKAVNLRYRFIPMLYSLAHRQYDSLEPMFRPLSYYWPHDVRSAAATDQWLVGSSVMVAPMLSVFPPWRQVYFPPGKWYRLGIAGESAVQGPSTVVLNSLPLDEIPIYAKAGAIVPLGPVVQSTAKLPGGPLEVQVYGGADGQFVLTEDDGESLGYQRGELRHTTFEWDDATATLTWNVTGNFSDAHIFVEFEATLFRPNGDRQRTVLTKLGRTGALHFGFYGSFVQRNAMVLGGLGAVVTTAVALLSAFVFRRRRAAQDLQEPLLQA